MSFTEFSRTSISSFIYVNFPSETSSLISERFKEEDRRFWVDEKTNVKFPTMTLIISTEFSGWIAPPIKILFNSPRKI